MNLNMKQQSNPEAVIAELNFLLENLCILELPMRGRQFIYRRINKYKDDIRKLQGSSQSNNGDID